MPNPTDLSGSTDSISSAMSDVVGNEQYADDEGVVGPDPAQWPAEGPEARAPEPEYDPGEGVVKGPDPAQHPDREIDRETD